MKKYPEFVKLDFPYSMNPMLEEVANYEKDLFWGGIMKSSIDASLTDPDYWLTAPKEYYSDCSHMTINPLENKTNIYIGKYKSWGVLNLRKLPHWNGNNPGSNKFRQSDYDEKWVWNDNYNVPEIRKVIDRLPYKKLCIARIMVIDEGGFGVVHRDLGSDDTYEKGIGSITLTLRSGGSPIEAKINGIIEKLDGPAFYFKDSNLHGVQVTKYKRIVIRTHGIIDNKKFQAMIQPETAIWVKS